MNNWRWEAALCDARQAVATCFNVDPSEVIFTSGATEANNLAIKGVARALKRGHIISVVTEHKSVLSPIETLRSQGFSTTLLPVRSDGSIDLDQLSDAIQPDTILASIMIVNNEIGIFTDKSGNVLRAYIAVNYGRVRFIIAFPS